MPHQCTNCDRTFEDGSKQMLGGCPNCGGNKFQFLPERAVESASEPEGRSNRIATKADGSPRPDADADIIEAPPEPIEATDGVEDRAQASARRAVVTEDELPPVDTSSGAEEPTGRGEKRERPDLAKLRKELDEQFESIKILRPGEYELNLMELYDRKEYIIALEEDGRYVIDVPDTWSGKE